MNRLIQPPQQPVSDGHSTRIVCCRIEPSLHIGAFFGGPWAELYRYAYKLALEQTTEAADHRRQLGHVEPSIN